MVQVQVDFIEMPQKNLAELLLGTTPSSDASELRGKVDGLLKSGVASVLESQVTTGNSGDKQLIESMDEYIYPTEYEPGSVPEKVALPDKPDGMTPEALKALHALVIPPTPTSFETKNLGSTLETEPTVSVRGDIISLALNPSLVWHTGDDILMEHKDLLGNISRMQMPKMYTLRLTTSLTLHSGKPAFVAALSPKDEHGVTDLTRKVMVFVKATAIEVK